MAKHTLTVKLDPTPEQAEALRQTLEAFNSACSWLAGIAFGLRSANKFEIQREAYRSARTLFGLSAQMAVRAIGKVCEAYKRDRSKRPEFRIHGAMPYDERIMAWKGLECVSLLTLSGRILVATRLGAYQTTRLDRRRGQADLILRDGKWFLTVTVEAPEAVAFAPEGVLGCDLGIINLLVDSDGNHYTGKMVWNVRHRHRRMRRKLQAKGTRGARRLLRKRRRKERRFQKHTNHCLSKEVVTRAKDTKRAIALEELTHIRSRITVRRPQRVTFSAWAFRELRNFIAYKARVAGVPVIFVDPRNTSRTCPACGHVDKANRKNQSSFLCVSCGCAGHADHFAALNIQRRGTVSCPATSRPGV